MVGEPWKDEERLRELHVEERLSYEEMADELGCSSSTIGNYIRKFGIERDETDKYPWREEDELERLYWEEEMSIGDIAEHWETHRDIIHRWLVKHDIDRRPGPQAHYPWQEDEILRELYERQGLSQREIAEKFDTGQALISKWIRRHGIETPDTWWKAGIQFRRVNHGFFGTSLSGYERVGSRVGETTKYIQVHRLVAVAEHGFDEVADKVVHHKNGIPWDNRPSNLEVMTDSEHKSLHARNRGEAPPFEV